MSFSFTASYIAIWILVFFQGLLVLALLRQLAELRKSVALGAVPGEDLLTPGTLAPKFESVDARSGRLVSSEIFAGQGGVLLFLSPDCYACKDLADGLTEPTTSELPPVVTLCQGRRQPCTRFAKRLGSKIPLIFDDAEDIASLYRVSGSPTAIAIDGDQRIRGYGHPQSVEDLERFVSRNRNSASTDTNVSVNESQAAFTSTVAQ